MRIGGSLVVSNRKNKFSLIVLDPHGDLAKKVLGFAHNTTPDRVVYVSSSINKEVPTNDHYTAIINPFICDKSDDTVNVLSQELADALIELLSDTQYNFTPQMQAILRPCIATVLRSENPSLNELKRFMLDGQNEDLVELGKRSSNAQHRDFFINDFHVEEYRLTKKSIRTKLTCFLGDQVLANMLNGTSTIDVEKCINEGSMLIFSLPKGSGKFTSSVFGRLMIAYLHSIFLKRAELSEKQRKQTFFVIDEFQSYITQSLAANLAEARKYGLSLILATQSLKSIENAPIRKTVMVNTGVKAVGQTDYEDRSTFAKELGIKGDLIEVLEPLQFYIKIFDGKHTPFRFNVPMLGKKYFLTERKRKELLEGIVYRSGQYVVVPPLPPAPQPQRTSIKQKVRK